LNSRAHLVEPHKTIPTKTFYYSTRCVTSRDIVPQQVICHKCGAVLYEGTELKPPDEIIGSYDSKCPNCGKKLSYIPIDVEVRPADETNQLGSLETENKSPSRKKSWIKTKKR